MEDVSNGREASLLIPFAKEAVVYIIPFDV